MQSIHRRRCPLAPRPALPLLAVAAGLGTVIVTEPAHAQAEKGVEPIVRGLNLPTRDEVQKLKKRMAQLEKRLDEIAGSTAP